MLNRLSLAVTCRHYVEYLSEKMTEKLFPVKSRSGHGKEEKESTRFFACLRGFQRMYGVFLDMIHEEGDQAESKRVRMTGVISSRPSKGFVPELLNLASMDGGTNWQSQNRQWSHTYRQEDKKTRR